MINIYKQIEPLKNLRFPLDRGKSSVYCFLEGYFEKYRKNINQITFLEATDIKLIEKICIGILKCLSDYDTYSIKEAYETFYSFMDQIRNDLWYEFIEDTHLDGNGYYYRLRKTKRSKEYSTLDMLHIPFTEREKASSSRFSLPGIPCTYMSTQPTIAWYESRLPQEFCMARFKVNTAEFKKYKMLCLNINPLLYFHNIELALIRNIEKEYVEKLIKRACIMIPLVSACSFKVRNKNISFIEEYVIPQMLMSWIRQDKEFIGINYNTATFYEDARVYNAYNTVIPAKEFGSDGYCQFLKTLFISSNETKIVSFDIIKKLGDIKTDVEALYKYYDTVRHDYQTCNIILPYEDIISICRSFLACWEHLNEDYENTAILCFQTIKSLIKYCRLTIGLLQKEYGSDYSKFYVEKSDEPLLSQDIKNAVKRTLHEFDKHVVFKVIESFQIFDYVVFLKEFDK